MYFGTPSSFLLPLTSFPVVLVTSFCRPFTPFLSAPFLPLAPPITFLSHSFRLPIFLFSFFFSSRPFCFWKN